MKDVEVGEDVDGRAELVLSTFSSWSGGKVLRKLMETGGGGGRGDAVVDDGDLRPGEAGRGDGHGGVWRDGEGTHPLVTRQLLG